MALKEVIAVIRVNKVNATKTAWAEGGFPAFTCRPVLGRGKKGVDAAIIDTVLAKGSLPMNDLGQHLSEAGRLIAKRCFTLIVDAEKIEKVIDIIISVNKTGNKGDGKIFVLLVAEAYQVRNGEHAVDAY